MKHHKFTGWIFIAFLCAECFAKDPFDESTAQFASALKISIDSQGNIAKSTLDLSSKLPLKVEKYLLKQKGTRTFELMAPIDVDVLNNNDVVATGCFLTCDSFKVACNTLLRKLVMSSMPIKLLARRYEASHEAIGNLLIIEKSFDKTTGMYSSVPVGIHFVRGSTMISLRSPTPSMNIYDIAKALDAVLSDSCAEKPSNEQ